MSSVVDNVNRITCPLKWLQKCDNWEALKDSNDFNLRDPNCLCKDSAAATASVAMMKLLMTWSPSHKVILNVYYYVTVNNTKTENVLFGILMVGNEVQDDL